MSDAFTAEVELQFQAKVKEAVARAAKQAQEQLAEQLKELQDTLQAKEDAIHTFRANELDLRKLKQTLENEKEDFDLKLQRLRHHQRQLPRAGEPSVLPPRPRWRSRNRPGGQRKRALHL